MQYLLILLALLFVTPASADFYPSMWSRQTPAEWIAPQREAVYINVTLKRERRHKVKR